MSIILTSISKSYSVRTVLNDISLEIPRGASIAITGPSGSGKTTLLNIIGVLDKPDSGTVELNGTQTGKLSDRELAQIRNTTIGFIFQQHYLLPQCTVLENILIPTLALKNKNQKKDSVQKARRLLERAGLANHVNRKPSELSVGECQRAAFVRALINDPLILLADEPTGSLDQENAENLSNLLLELNKENGTTLVVVTHSIELAGKMDTAYILKNARLVKK